MSITLKKTFAGVALLAFLAFGAPTAKAQSVSELQAMIAALQAQIAALAGGSSSSSCTYVHTVTLKQGSTGSQVAAMQAVIGATADGKFGPMTKAKVQAFQASKGLVADGVVGPNTGAAIAASCAGNNGGGSSDDNSSSDLEGSFGSIKDVNKLTAYNNEEVGEDESDVKVAGFEVEATNDGDISISSMKVTFTITNASGSDNLDDYADNVSIWMGTKKVGEADARDFSEGSSGVWSRTIQISNAIVRADRTEKFYIAVDAIGSFDSGDIDSEVAVVDLNNIRFEDGSGVVTTETGYDIGSIDSTVAFVSFSAAANTELKFSKDSDSPVAGIVVVNDEDGEDDVVLLKGRMKLNGSSDLVIDEIPFTITVGGGDELADVASDIILVLDGEEYSETAATTTGTTAGTITFDNLDFDMSAGGTVDFEIRANVFGTNDHGEGDSLTASFTSDNRSAVDAEDEAGDQISDSDKTGTAVGEAMEIRSKGIMVTLVDTNQELVGDNVSAAFTIKFKVEAVGDDIYVGTVANSSKYGIVVENSSGTATTIGVSHTITNSGGSGNSTSTTSGGNWKINEDTSVTITIQSFAASASVAADAYRSALSSLYWTDDDTDAVTTTDNSYSSDMDDFHTNYVQLL